MPNHAVLDPQRAQSAARPRQGLPVVAAVLAARTDRAAARLGNGAARLEGAGDRHRRRLKRRPGFDRGFSGRRPAHEFRDPRLAWRRSARPRIPTAPSATWSSRSRSAAITACRSTAPRHNPASHWHGLQPRSPHIAMPIRCLPNGNRTRRRKRCSMNASPACSAGRWPCTRGPNAHAVELSVPGQWRRMHAPCRHRGL